MKIYAIKNEALHDLTIGFLFYYEIKKKFYIELVKNENVWEIPLLLRSQAQKGNWTIDSYRSEIWVEERIVPFDRQNIAQILRDNGLKTYDKFKLLILSNGRCAQDDCYLKPVYFEEIPEDIKKRFDYRIKDFLLLSDRRLIVFFQNGKVKVCEFVKILKKVQSIEKMLEVYPDSVNSMQIETGGYGIQFDERKRIPDKEFYENGTDVFLTADDFSAFISKRVVNTREAAEILNCSRQNINDLVKRKKLVPLKEDEKGKLFLTSDIEKREWE